MDQNVRVKLIHRSNQANQDSAFKKQTPHNEGKLGRCTFTFNPLDENYDWYVVIDDVARIVPNRTEVLKCPRENTILATTEPSTIARYGRAFAGQFHYLITNQDADVLPHPNAIRSQTGNIWMYGKDYDQIINMGIPQKTKKLSTICSNKREGHTMHRMRYDFTLMMEELIPELERFGRGFRWIDQKAEALDDYQFHVAIENHIGDNVWTEKLADAFLGYTVPIYCGCPNVYDYFPEDSLILIDIHDMDGSIRKIKEVIAREGEYERRLPAVLEARRRVIEEYNLLAMVNKIVEKAEPSEFVPNQKIYSRRIMRIRHLPDLGRFAAFRFRNAAKNAMVGLGLKLGLMR